MAMSGVLVLNDQGSCSLTWAVCGGANRPEPPDLVQWSAQAMRLRGIKQRMLAENGWGRQMEA